MKHHGVKNPHVRLDTLTREHVRRRLRARYEGLRTEKETTRALDPWSAATGISRKHAITQLRDDHSRRMPRAHRVHLPRYGRS